MHFLVLNVDNRYTSISKDEAKVTKTALYSQSMNEIDKWLNNF
ncbi:MAG: hypothetical protein QG565_1631 [Campylobacterota bacterium]|nr:hypothetical protein [Campylobacterota bacterium]